MEGNEQCQILSDQVGQPTNINFLLAARAISHLHLLFILSNQETKSTDDLSQ